MPSSARILGVLLPEDGPDDYEWYGMERLAQRFDATLPSVRVGPVPSDGHHDPRALRALGSPQRLIPVASELNADGNLHGCVWACTSASFIGGLHWAREQAAQLQRALDIPVTSTALAFVDACVVLAQREVDLLSAYPEPVTRRLVAFLLDAGIHCRRVKALECAYAADSHRLEIGDEIESFCEQQPTNGSVPIMVPDTAINTLGVLPELSAKVTRTILTANQVSLWSGLRLLGWSTQNKLLGSLAGH